MTDIHTRAKRIEQLVNEYEGCEDADAADMAYDRIRESPERSDSDIACEIANCIANP